MWAYCVPNDGVLGGAARTKVLQIPQVAWGLGVHSGRLWNGYPEARVGVVGRAGALSPEP